MNKIHMDSIERKAQQIAKLEEEIAVELEMIRKRNIDKALHDARVVRWNYDPNSDTLVSLTVIGSQGVIRIYPVNNRFKIVEDLNVSTRSDVYG